MKKINVQYLKTKNKLINMQLEMVADNIITLLN